MAHDDYWAKRFAMLMAAEMKKADDLTAELVAAYRQTAEAINADIAKWYARFAKENKMSLADARRVLNARELAEFRWTVQEYIRYGEENALTGVYIQRLKNASARVHIDRLEAIRSQMAHHVESLAAKTNEKLTEVLKDIYPDARERTAWEVQRKKGFDPFAALPEGEVERVLKKPWVGDGMTFSDRIWRDKEKLLRVLQTDLTQGLIRGEGYDKIARRIAEKMGVARSAAARLVETEAAFFSSRGQLDSFQALGVKEVEFVATLDSRTSEICQAMDGKVLPLSECKPGITMPPLHCRCRSTTCPHFDDAFTEGETRAARDPETGKTVQIPGEMRYADWKKVFVDKEMTLEEWQNFEKNIIPATDDYIALLARRHNLAYTKGKKGRERFYSDDGMPIYPPNDGAVGKPEIITIPVGETLLTRYGNEYGRYVSPGNIPFFARSLPRTVDKSTDNFHMYKVVKEIQTVQSAKIAPWFGEIGGGTQYKLPKSVAELLKGYLLEVNEHEHS